MTVHDDVVKAVAEALQANWNLWPADALRMAQDAVAAAAPILLAAERTRIAAEVRAMGHGDYYHGSAWPQEDAAEHCGRCANAEEFADRVEEATPEEET